MAILSRISPASAFKVGFVVFGFLGLLAGSFCALIAFAAPAAHARMPFPAVGAFAVILCPIICGILGGIVSAIGAVLYNLAARWVGGIEAEIV